MSLEAYSPLKIIEVGKVKPAVLPDDLKGLISLLFDIKRYEDPNYPRGVFDDNVGRHEMRLVEMNAAIGRVQGVDSKKMARMFWVHDIPEIFIGEFTSPQKESNMELAKRLEIEEEESAGRILIASDMSLLREFNAGGKFLKGEAGGIATPENLLATVLDKIDGNMLFHHFLAEWVANGGQFANYPLGNALSYTFKQKERFDETLGKLHGELGGAAEKCRELLDYQIGFIENAWKSVKKSKRPEIINKYLQ